MFSQRKSLLWLAIFGCFSIAIHYRLLFDRQYLKELKNSRGMEAVAADFTAYDRSLVPIGENQFHNKLVVIVVVGGANVSQELAKWSNIQKHINANVALIAFVDASNPGTRSIRSEAYPFVMAEYMSYGIASEAVEAHSHGQLPVLNESRHWALQSYLSDSESTEVLINEILNLR